MAQEVNEKNSALRSLLAQGSVKGRCKLWVLLDQLPVQEPWVCITLRVDYRIIISPFACSPFWSSTTYWKVPSSSNFKLAMPPLGIQFDR